MDLLKEMLIYLPVWRITASKALGHRFLRDVPHMLPPIPSLYEDPQPPAKRRRLE